MTKIGGFLYDEMHLKTRLKFDTSFDTNTFCLKFDTNTFCLKFDSRFDIQTVYLYFDMRLDTNLFCLKFGLYLFSHPGVSHPGVWGCENKFWP